jgi:uncharacterized protein (DUF362 family)/Pyruvate/2-oxoacid:ferredoxin oxidoreductase delta subunit
MSQVALVRCESYDYEDVEKAVEKGIGLIGGCEAFAQAGENILLKPNWIVASAPEKCAVTHPSVFRAVARVFLRSGVSLSFGDSPSHHSPELAARKAGYAEIASELGIHLADFTRGREVLYEKALQNKRFTIANAVLESDGIVSLPKLKTHGFLKLSGAIKNQLGCVPGLLKAEFHLKLANPVAFARMLVDLNGLVHPRLFIMDGIICMEGNGPMGGDPRNLGVLLFSRDPVALDATVCRLVDVDPELSYTITEAARAGYGTYKADEIEITGDPLESFIDRAFNVNRESIPKYRAAWGTLRFFNNSLIPKPVISESSCSRCCDCVKVCPVSPKALGWPDHDKTKPPSYSYERCIRCYCCQEVCPNGAISLKVPFIRKFFLRERKKPAQRTAGMMK